MRDAQAVFKFIQATDYYDDMLKEYGSDYVFELVYDLRSLLPYKNDPSQADYEFIYKKAIDRLTEERIRWGEAQEQEYIQDFESTIW